MTGRQMAYLLAGTAVLAGLAGCNCTNKKRVGYVPPPPGVAGCERCAAANGPMPPLYVPNAAPGPGSLPPGAIAAPPGAAMVPPGGIAPPGQASSPFGAAIQQNNYLAPGSFAPSASPPQVYLGQPEAAKPSAEARSSPVQTQEPPTARDDRAASPTLPVDIPQFVQVKSNIANGQEPFAGGIAWLKAHGYRTVLHVRAPGADDGAARRAVEQGGLRYRSLELSPQILTKETVDTFNGLVADAGNLPLFVYDQDGTLAGALWYLHFRLVDRAAEDKARAEAERLGFKADRGETHLKMWLAVQKFLKDHAS